MLGTNVLTILIGLVSTVSPMLYDLFTYFPAEPQIKVVIPSVTRYSPRPTASLSPTPTVAAITTTNPTPRETPTPSLAVPTPSDCDLVLHQTFQAGAPADIHRDCTTQTSAGGTVSSKVDIKANTSGQGSGQVSVDISIKNK